MKKSFYKNYVTTAARKFFFFLENQKKGLVQIDDMVASSHLLDFSELQHDEVNVSDMSNWFSMASTQSVHSTINNIN